MPDDVPKSDTPLLTVGMAAEVLGVNRKTVQRWLDDGSDTLTVSAVIGQLRLLSADDVLALKAKRAADKAARAQARATAKAGAA
jgi:excisionase family DNA binding protein